jgi:Spy/CpxP family protein refolding chaperone
VNIRKGVGESRMRRCIMVCVVLAVLCCAAGIFAQEEVKEGTKDLNKENNKRGVSLSELSLSEAQNTSIEQINAGYRERIIQLRSEVMVNQIELKSQLRDPEVQETKIEAMARDIRIMHVKLQKMMIDYQLEIRRILTPDQIRLWRTLENPPTKRGWRE